MHLLNIYYVDESISYLSVIKIMSRRLISFGIAAGIMIPNVVLAEQAVIHLKSTQANLIGDRILVR